MHAHKSAFDSLDMHANAGCETFKKFNLSSLTLHNIIYKNDHDNFATVVQMIATQYQFQV